MQKRDQTTRLKRRIEVLTQLRDGTHKGRLQEVVAPMRIAGLVEYPYEKDSGKITGKVTLTAFGYAFLKHHGVK